MKQRLACMRILAVAYGLLLGGAARAQELSKVDTTHVAVKLDNDTLQVTEVTLKPGGEAGPPLASCVYPLHDPWWNGADSVSGRQDGGPRVGPRRCGLWRSGSAAYDRERRQDNGQDSAGGGQGSSRSKEEIGLVGIWLRTRASASPPVGGPHRSRGPGPLSHRIPSAASAASAA